jgi:hypothetical protein
MVVLMSASMATSPAFAQDASPESSRRLVINYNTGTSATSSATQSVSDFRQPGRSAVLASAYTATVLMQALDAHSTFAALDAGGVEMNPLVASMTRNRTSFVALKAAMAAGLVYGGHSVGKKSKIGAIAILAAANTAYAYLAYKNYQVARTMRGRQ